MFMMVCTLSFPNYGFMGRKLRENAERQKLFQEDMIRRAPNLDKEGIKVNMLRGPQFLIQRIWTFIIKFWGEGPTFAFLDFTNSLLTQV